MKLTLIIAFLSLLPGTASRPNQPSRTDQPARPDRNNQDFDRSAFYTAMASGDLHGLNKELAIVGDATIAEKRAYEGALLMRKAGELKIPGDKLRFFRLGRIKLESALSKDPGNGEYHFLRLTIQEHAPHIVKYYKDLEEDRQAIRNTFKDLLPPVQQAIRDYSRTSKTLHPEDLEQKSP